MRLKSQNQFTSVAPFYDELMDSVPYSRWVDYVLLLCKNFGHKPQHVLDCACGTGNVTYELARRGLEVTGVDLSEDMIEIAKAKQTPRTNFWRKAVRPRFVHSDICRMNLGDTFDTITCLYDSLNYLTDPTWLQSAFKQMHKHARDNALLIFDLNTPYSFEIDLFTQSAHNARQSLHYDWQATYDQQTQICKVDMDFRRNMEDGSIATFSETHYERAYSIDTIRKLLSAAGWSFVQYFEAYKITEPDARTVRWFVVARRLKEKQ